MKSLRVLVLPKHSWPHISAASLNSKVIQGLLKFSESIEQRP